MISTSEFKRGLTIELKGEIYSIVEFQHVKPGKGGAFVRTKLKNVKTGLVVDKTFRAGEKMEQAIIDRNKMQYLYNDANFYYFMNKDNYEQTSISENYMAEIKDFLKEGNDVEIIFCKGEVIGAELPNFMNLKIVDTVPGVKGNTVSGALKPATLETGAIVQVPLFVKEGDLIKVDTREKKYMERA
ncbi:MAG: elongation factor P [Candidatus Caldatribacteriota bacterium]|nr:elongation factor P [Candidatus Caldatribacteriota bacterium]